MAKKRGRPCRVNKINLELFSCRDCGHLALAVPPSEFSEDRVGLTTHHCTGKWVFVTAVTAQFDETSLWAARGLG